jgi:hypothetical protein
MALDDFKLIEILPLVKRKKAPRSKGFLVQTSITLGYGFTHVSYTQATATGIDPPDAATSSRSLDCRR